MKDSTKDTFEEFIEKSLKDYEEDPSDFLWAELEHNIPPPPNNPFPFLGLTVFSVTILLSIVGALFYFNSKAEDVDLSLQNQDVKINEIAKEVERITNQLKTSNTATSAKFQNEEKEISTKKCFIYVHCNELNNKTFGI